MNTNAKGQVVRDDLSGKRFGNVIVQPQWQKTSNGGTKWLVECQCELKTQWWVWAEILKRSPGMCCMECRKKIIAKCRTTHGMRNHPLYGVWKNMLDRCYDPNHKSYHRYGGRGITVCQRWHKFENFRDDMLPTYRSGLTIHRKDNDGNYEPSNCEWRTRKGQAQVRVTTKYLTAFGQTHNYSEWSEITGIDKTTIRSRVLLGWPPEKCLSTNGCRKIKKGS